jgi:ComEC/Rec2-related protein
MNGLLLFRGLSGPVVLRFIARLRSTCPLLPIAAGLVAGQGLAWWGLGYAAVALLLLLITHRWRWSAVGAPFGIGLAAGCLSMGLLISGLPDNFSSRETRLVAKVIEAPRRRSPGSVQFEVQILREVSDEESALKGRRLRCRAVDLPWREIDGMVRGDIFVILARVAPVDWNSNPFSYDATLLRHGVSGECRVRYAARLLRGVPGIFERMREGIKEHARVALGNHERAGLILALTLGERDALSNRTEIGFREAGLSHLLVLSGYQVSLVYAILFWALRALLRTATLRGSLWVRAPGIFSFLLTSAFVALVGVESSSLRAAIAMVLVVAARLSERASSLWTSILGSLCVLTVLCPGAIFEPGVQLTYGALFGIALGAEGSKGKLETFLSVSVWATLIPLALSAVWFGAVALGGLLLNPALAPVLSLAGTIAGGAALALKVVGIDRSGILLDLIANVLTVLRELVVQSARLPWVFAECGAFEAAALFAFVVFLCLLKARSILKSRLKGLNFMHHSVPSRVG